MDCALPATMGIKWWAINAWIIMPLCHTATFIKIHRPVFNVKMDIVCLRTSVFCQSKSKAFCQEA
jgi:hypothetical protein